MRNVGFTLAAVVLLPTVIIYEIAFMIKLQLLAMVVLFSHAFIEVQNTPSGVAIVREESRRQKLKRVPQ